MFIAYLDNEHSRERARACDGQRGYRELKREPGQMRYAAAVAGH
jgi:hypothetical protein